MAVRRAVCGLAAAFGLFGAAAEASVTKLGFDTLPAGETAGKQYSGVTITATPTAAIILPASELLEPGVHALFDNPTTLAEEVHLPRHLLAVAPEPNGGAAGAGALSFIFDRAVRFRSMKVFGAGKADSVSVEFYDVNNLLIGAGANGMVTTEHDEFLSFTFDVDGVRRAVVSFSGPGAVDDLVYEAVSAPAPAALTLFVAALAGLGFAMRRRSA